MQTIRQELITSAASRMRRNNISAYAALEAESSENRTFESGTVGAAMREYYLNTTDAALERLIKAVERKAAR